MKPQSWFLVKVSPYRKAALISLVQAMCAEPFMKEVIAIGPWEFKIDTTDNSSWWHLWITAEYDVWRKINPEPMEKWLKERLVEYEREGLSEEADRLPETA